MNKIISSILFFAFLVVFVAMPAHVLAQDEGGRVCPDGATPVGGRCPLENPAQGFLVDFGDFGSLLKRIVEILLEFAGAIAVIYLVIGGYQYVVSRGNEEAMEGAKKTVTSAIMGIVIIVLAFALVQIVNNLLTG